MGYDGVVLESWSRWAAYRVLDDKDMRGMVTMNSDASCKFHVLFIIYFMMLVMELPLISVLDCWVMLSMDTFFHSFSRSSSTYTLINLKLMMHLYIRFIQQI